MRLGDKFCVGGFGVYQWVVSTNGPDRRDGHFEASITWCCLDYRPKKSGRARFQYGANLMDNVRVWRFYALRNQLDNRDCDFGQVKVQHRAIPICQRGLWFESRYLPKWAGNTSDNLPDLQAGWTFTHPSCMNWASSYSYLPMHHAIKSTCKETARRCDMDV